MRPPQFAGEDGCALAFGLPRAPHFNEAPAVRGGRLDRLVVDPAWEAALQ